MEKNRGSLEGKAGFGPNADEADESTSDSESEEQQSSDEEGEHVSGICCVCTSEWGKAGSLNPRSWMTCHLCQQTAHLRCIYGTIDFKKKWCRQLQEILADGENGWLCHACGIFCTTKKKPVLEVKGVVCAAKVKVLKHMERPFSHEDAHKCVVCPNDSGFLIPIKAGDLRSYDNVSRASGGERAWIHLMCATANPFLRLKFDTRGGSAPYSEVLGFNSCDKEGIPKCDGPNGIPNDIHAGATRADTEFEICQGCEIGEVRTENLCYFQCCGDDNLLDKGMGNNHVKGTGDQGACPCNIHLSCGRREGCYIHLSTRNSCDEWEDHEYNWGNQQSRYALCPAHTSCEMYRQIKRAFGEENPVLIHPDPRTVHGKEVNVGKKKSLRKAVAAMKFFLEKFGPVQNFQDRVPQVKPEERGKPEFERKLEETLSDLIDVLQETKLTIKKSLLPWSEFWPSWKVTKECAGPDCKPIRGVWVFMLAAFLHHIAKGDRKGMSNNLQVKRVHIILEPKILISSKEFFCNPKGPKPSFELQVVRVIEILSILELPPRDISFFNLIPDLEEVMKKNENNKKQIFELLRIWQAEVGAKRLYDLRHGPEGRRIASLIGNSCKLKYNGKELDGSVVKVNRNGSVDVLWSKSKEYQTLEKSQFQDIIGSALVCNTLEESSEEEDDDDEWGDGGSKSVDGPEVIPLRASSSSEAVGMKSGEAVHSPSPPPIESVLLDAQGEEDLVGNHALDSIMN